MDLRFEKDVKLKRHFPGLTVSPSKATKLSTFEGDTENLELER